SARGRPASVDVLRGCRGHPLAPGARPLRAHHGRGAQGVSPARRADDRRGTELQGPMRAPDLAAVGELVQDVAHRVVLPRFRDLAAGEISEKSPGDLVTAVVVVAEQFITAGPAELSSGIPVVGEEAVEADPSVLVLVGGDGYAFVVDPIDGTRAFV